VDLFVCPDFLSSLASRLFKIRGAYGSLGSSSLAPRLVGSVLQPPDLSCRSISLLVPSCYPEDDGRFGRGVDVGRQQVIVVNHTGGRGAAEHAHEGELGGARGHRFSVTLLLGSGALHREVHRVLCDLP